MAKTTKKSSQTKTQTHVHEAKLTWLPDKTFELEIIIPQDEIKKTYEDILAEAVKTTTVKGFRKGKAPKNLVEQQIGKASLYEEVVQHVVTHAYFHAVKQHNLHPIMNPVVTPIAMPEDKDWIVKASACEAPEVKLGDYKGAIKGLKAKSSIWTPDKGTPKPEEKEAEQSSPSLDEIFDELLKNAEVEIPKMLLEQEANRLLTQLIDQVQAVGMTIQQYLENKGKTQESLRAEYAQAARKTLQLEFILAKISQENSIAVTDKEIEDIVAKNQDPYAKKALESQDQRAYLALILRKQKTIDFLKSL
ncbi:hypothetical protein GYA49_01860 [Candidatus Beckwithbacteria bacterium]|nr:hypothetical protein [Candidatus Beckwithbacteria bacterium]